MRRRSIVGCFALIAASFGLAAPPANACDDDCECDYYGYAAPAYSYGGYYRRPAFAYYARPAYAYYAAPVYAAPVYPVAAYYAPPPVYYAPPVYRHPYGWRSRLWRRSYVYAGPAPFRGNVIAAKAGPRAVRTVNRGDPRLSKASPVGGHAHAGRVRHKGSSMPPQADARATYALGKAGRHATKARPATGRVHAEPQRGPRDLRVRRELKPQPAPARRPIETALHRANR